MKKSDLLVENYLGARTKHFNVLLVQYWSLIIFKVLITAAMLVVGAVLTINNQINLGQFVAAEIVIILIMGSVEKFIFSLDNVYDLLTSVEKIGKVLDKPMDTYGTLTYQPTTQGVDIKLENLSFSFDEKINVLNNVSLSIAAGSKVCIMGEEGAGKSMLLRMLTGCYTDFSGSVIIDNISINRFMQTSLQQHMGIILSDQDIFSGTLLENVTVGRTDFSLEKLAQLTKLVGLHDYLQQLPAGYETLMDTAGKRLSRSIVQKILLVRALLHDPVLLLLENPWTSLYSTVAQSIQSYILNHMPGTTVIVVSNNQDFAGKCDRIIKMAAGSIIISGTHGEVL